MASVVEAYRLGNQWVADVPNTLLQENLSILVYGYDKDYTKYEDKFKVVGRAKPDDYVYTDVEVERWTELEERIDQIEENGVSDEKIAEAVTAYLDENPVEVPVESVNGKTGAVELTYEDVGALAADTPIPSTAGLATEKYVDEKIANIPETDLTGYATKTYVDDEIGKIDIPDTDLSDYYTKTQTDKAISDAVGDIEVPTVPTNVSAFTNDAGYATETYVGQKISEAQLGGGDADLSNYYTKAETDALIPDVSGFTTMSAVEAKGYQTASDVETAISGKGYQTETQVQALINAKFDSIIDAEEVSY